MERTARAFTTAYAGHDARDGGDRTYADAGVRAAKHAAGELAEVLRQQRPGQDGAWAELRSEKAVRTAQIKTVVTPDGAPAADESSAVVRVGYTLTTTPASGATRTSSEQIALRMEHTASGWRVVALPWS
ncbi:hypothetical protein GCM10017688_05590 [Streptomyces ramulosus]